LSHASRYFFGSSAPATNHSLASLHIWYTLIRKSGHVLTRLCPARNVGGVLRRNQFRVVLADILASRSLEIGAGIPYLIPYLEGFHPVAQVSGMDPGPSLRPPDGILPTGRSYPSVASPTTPYRVSGVISRSP
jgi:hypothetical protein